MRAMVVNLLRSIRHEATDGHPEPNSPSVLWVTGGVGTKPEEAAVFLKLRPRQRVVALGGAVTAGAWSAQPFARRRPRWQNSEKHLPTSVLKGVAAISSRSQHRRG